jgi:hypothetical protein
MITIAVERWKEFGDEFKVLSFDHWMEVAIHRDSVPLDPNWETYEKADSIGKMIFVGCRDEGKLVGYSVWAITYPLHFKTTLYAQNDVIYLQAKYRGDHGLKLIKESERFMVEQGVKKILWGVMANKDWSRILQRMGYDQEDILMSKVIK